MPFDPEKVTLNAREKAFIAWYDARCKRILSNRMLLAHLLKATMTEFASLEPEVIATRYIEGVPGQENHSQKIQGLRNERNDPHRNACFFDVIFYALDPRTEHPIPIFINVESQWNSFSSYDLRNRGIFYIGCMIADQKDCVFEKSNYDDLRKVCSIWICPNSPKNCANTITSYTLDQHNILGNSPNHPVDKLQLLMVSVGTANDDHFTGVIPLLEACFSKTTDKDHQKQITDQYNVKLEQEDYDMTIGEQIIYDFKREIWESEERGKEIGEKIGKEIGKEIGEKLGKDDEKKRIAKSMKDDHVNSELIAQYTGLSPEQIKAL